MSRCRTLDPIRSALLPVLMIAACTATQPAATQAPAAPSAASWREHTWRERMAEIDAQCDILLSVLEPGGATDLRLAATAATAAAEHLRLGYGPHEDRSVPGFARMAHEAETWLLNIALEARQAHGDIARELFLAGKRHCKNCHEAHDRVHG